VLATQRDSTGGQDLTNYEVLAPQFDPALDPEVIAAQERQRVLTEIAAQGGQARVAIHAEYTRQMLAQDLMMMGQGLMALGAHNKKMFKLGQAASIAGALINTYEGVTQALKAYPPPYSFIAAGAQLAMGMAQVAQIKSQKPPAYALGTYNVPETGPAILHQGEAVIPRELNPFNGSGGGMGSTTVNLDFSRAYINDHETARSLAEMVEDAVRRKVVQRFTH
jgi:hypothetical protein